MVLCEYCHMTGFHPQTLQKTGPIIKFNNHVKQFLLRFLVVVRLLYYSDRAHTVLKSP